MFFSGSWDVLSGTGDIVDAFWCIVVVITEDRTLCDGPVSTWTVFADGWLAGCSGVELCCNLNTGVWCVCAPFNVSDRFAGDACGLTAAWPPVKSLGNLLVKSCWMLLVFSIARLIQDTSGVVVWGVDCDSWEAMGVVSTSLWFNEVVWTSVGMVCGSQLYGGLRLLGRVKPDGAGSMEWHKSIRETCSCCVILRRTVNENIKGHIKNGQLNGGITSNKQTVFMLIITTINNKRMI